MSGRPKTTICKSRASQNSNKPHSSECRSNLHPRPPDHGRLSSTQKLHQLDGCDLDVMKTNQMREPYQGYAECCKRWDKIRGNIKLSDYLDRIQANIDASDDAANWMAVGKIIEKMGYDAFLKSAERFKPNTCFPGARA